MAGGQQSINQIRDQFTNLDAFATARVSLGASFGPGSHPTGHAAFGVDGASRFDPIARGSVRAFNGD